MDDTDSVTEEGVFEVVRWDGDLPELIGTIFGVQVCMIPTYVDEQVVYKTLVMTIEGGFEDNPCVTV